MSKQFRFACQTYEGVADHLERPLRWLATSPETDQPARDHRTLDLDLDSIPAVIYKVRAAQQLFKKSFIAPH